MVAPKLTVVRNSYDNIFLSQFFVVNVQHQKVVVPLYAEK
jgi:hypothetical protein